MSNSSYETMKELFIFETAQLLEQLEQIILAAEKSRVYSEQDINEIFRAMHTIKSSSAMMDYENISRLAHAMEDLFYYIREKKPSTIEFSELTDRILKGSDFIQTELSKIEASQSPDADPQLIISEIISFLEELKKQNAAPQKTSKRSKETQPAEAQPRLTASENHMPDPIPSENHLPDPTPPEDNISGSTPLEDQMSGSAASTPTCATSVSSSSEGHFSGPVMKNYKALIYFEEDCQMEDIRAFSIIHNLKELAEELHYFPQNITEDPETEKIIRSDGFKVIFKSDSPIEAIRENLMQEVFIKSLTLEEFDNEDEMNMPKNRSSLNTESVMAHKETLNGDGDHLNGEKEAQYKAINQSMISVNVNKLDKLMDLVGELVTSESMVTQNTDLMGLVLENFNKAARQLKKITSELQDTVMSIRMVPVSGTFQKMNRIVRDMSKKLGKSVRLEIIGEETEVDKNIIEHISDPLMHLIRNAIDHGIETKEERISKGKDECGKITLEAKNAGGDVLIIVKDDGKGLDREKILAKAKLKGLLDRPESELSDRDIQSLIFLPGFSTNENVTEYSGRGVGMDVVSKNIEKINGSVSVESKPGEGTAFILRIPLTLAIIDGMNVRVGKSTYTIPTISIRQCFRPGDRDVFQDTEGNELIMIRGQCYPIIRLHRIFNVHTEIIRMHEGIIVMVESGNRIICVFADELMGEQQVVVKALPSYIRKVRGIAGCTLLGNGDISLILDITQLADFL